MRVWFSHTVIATGRLPLACFFACFVLGFAVIRLSVRMIRARVRWWPGNVSRGGLHIHHVVFGVVFMVVGGVGGLAATGSAQWPNAIFAGLFGLGTALVLDEFALILHLRDVYWTKAGRTSIDAVFAATGIVGLLLLGMRPHGLQDLAAAGPATVRRQVAMALLLVSFALAVLTLLKGKIWTGLFGLFLPVLLIFGAARLARPGSPYARWRYRKGSPRMRRAVRRERRLRAPVERAKIWLQDLLSGRHDLPSDEG